MLRATRYAYACGRARQRKERLRAVEHRVDGRDDTVYYTTLRRYIAIPHHASEKTARYRVNRGPECHRSAPDLFGSHMPGAAFSSAGALSLRPRPFPGRRLFNQASPPAVPFAAPFAAAGAAYDRAKSTAAPLLISVPSPAPAACTAGSVAASLASAASPPPVASAFGSVAAAAGALVGACEQWRRCEPNPDIDSKARPHPQRNLPEESRCGGSLCPAR
eukprot:scaffold33961_cov112-Isochrysis_galbana.AAC.2